ncbi:hypothetical protein JCM3770_000932 [Rhodotorula araucariae]
MSSPPAQAAPAMSRPPRPFALSLFPAAPPLAPPPSPAPISFIHRGRAPPHSANESPAPPSLAPFAPPAPRVGRDDLDSSPCPPPPTANSPEPRVRLPFTSLLVTDPSLSSPAIDKPATPAQRQQQQQQSKKHRKKQQHAQSRSTPARTRFPAVWAARKDGEGTGTGIDTGTGKAAPPQSKEVEYLQVDAKLEWAMEALGF